MATIQYHVRLQHVNLTKAQAMQLEKDINTFVGKLVVKASAVKKRVRNGKGIKREIDFAQH